MRKLFRVAILTFLYSLNAFSQQMPEISVFDQNQTIYNPGFIGNQEVLAANFYHRKNWINFDAGSPSTQFFCAHAPLKNPNVALGILLEHDGTGGKNNTGAFFNYTYRLQLGMNRLAFGLKGGITNISQDAVKLRTDPDPVFDKLNYMLPNFGLGISYYGAKYWAGISVPRIFGHVADTLSDRYKLDFEAPYFEYFIAGGGTLDLNPDFSIIPSSLLVLSGIYKTRFGLNMLATYKQAYSAGLGFHSGIRGNELALITQFSFNRQLCIGLSYDFIMGKIRNYSSGSYEINISYKFGYKVNAANPRGF